MKRMLFVAVALALFGAAEAQISVYVEEYRGNEVLMKDANTPLPDAAYQKIYPINIDDPEELHRFRLLSRKNNKWGWIDINNKILVPHQYEVQDESRAFNIDGYSFLDADMYIAASKDKKWGILDYEGKEVINFDYDYICGDGRDFFFGQKQNKIYKLSLEGKVEGEVPYKYLHGVLSFPDEEGNWTLAAIVSKNNKNLVGYNPVTKKELSIKACIQATKRLGNEYDPLILRIDQRYTFLNEAGQVMGKRYDEIQNLYGMGSICRAGNNWGYVNTKAEEVVAPSYTKLVPYFGLNETTPFAYAAYSSKGGQLMDGDKKLMSPLYFDAIAFYAGDYEWSVMQNRKWGGLGSNGEIVVACAYDAPVFIEKGEAQALYPVKLGGKWGYINRKGEMIVQPQFDEASEVKPDLSGRVMKDNKEGHVDMNGQIKWRE